jgi:hypothetical protein
MLLLAADGALVSRGLSFFPQQDSGREDFWRRVLLPKNLLAASARAPYALIRAVVRFFTRNFPLSRFPSELCIAGGISMVNEPSTC